MPRCVGGRDGTKRFDPGTVNMQLMYTTCAAGAGLGWQRPGCRAAARSAGCGQRASAAGAPPAAGGVAAAHPLLPPSLPPPRERRFSRGRLGADKQGPIMWVRDGTPLDVTSKAILALMAKPL